MKRFLTMLTAAALCVFLLAGCIETESQPVDKKTSSISVVSTFGGDDSNRSNYLGAIRSFEEKSGVHVFDSSQSSREIFKKKVQTDFETGSEPDVLFFFTGADADSFIKADKVVPIEEIRQVYPDYASNMRDDLLPLSTYDGKAYAVPVTGYWEGLYVNKRILRSSGVAFPGEDYTWEKFLADCARIKQVGYTPIDLSVANMPHYWWEYAVMNNGSVETQLELCESPDDAVGKKWQAAIEDIKLLYDSGFLPADTLDPPAADPYTSGAHFRDEGSAAFIIEGSWFLSGLAENIENGVLNDYDYDDFGVTYVPAKGERKAADIITGISSGYYITRIAWEDEAKRDAVVDFVSYMTSDAVVSRFATTSNSITALKNSSGLIGENSLEQSALDMCSGATGTVSAVQDVMGDAKSRLFGQLPFALTGKTDAKSVISFAIGNSQ